MEEIIIYLGKSPQQTETLLSFCQHKKIKVHLLNDTHMHQQVLSLFNIEETKGICLTFPFDFILFKNNDREIITSFYQEVKSIIHFTHKAILTQHNQQWLLHDLLVEMQEEHLFLKIGNAYMIY